MIDFELSFSVADVTQLDQAQNDLFDQVYRAAAAAGANFAPRLAWTAPKSAALEEAPRGTPQRLLAGISLFSSLSAQEKASLAQQMERREYKAGEVILPTGAVSQVLHIVSRGVVAAIAQVGGQGRGSRPPGARAPISARSACFPTSRSAARSRPSRRS